MNYSKLQETWFKKLIKQYSHRFVPSWYILAFDITIIFCAFYFAYMIRQNFVIQNIDFFSATLHASITTIIYGFFFVVFRSYTGIIRHTSIHDALKLFQANSLAFIFVLLLTFGLKHISMPYLSNVSIGVVIIHFLLSYFILMGARFIVKALFYKIAGSSKKQNKRVVIFGAGASGMLTIKALLQDKYISYQIVGFADENPGKIGKKLEGIKIYSPDYVLNKKFVENFHIDQIIISIQGLSINKQKAIAEKALDLNLEIKVVPTIDNWINGKLSSEQIRKIKIEELLQREPIKMDTTYVSKYLSGKVVMISGAAGSIGSGIVKQVLSFKPSKLILLDQAESGLYDLQYEIDSNPKLQPFSHLIVNLIANIKDRFRLEQIFEKHKPEIIFHAAAYKHVPLMEQNPYEALLVNVFGSKALADLAVKYKTKKFVMVSTDKAVNPTNVMGASKRIAEIYTQGLSNGCTQFITTRFGNVLDTNGSVVPLFKKQIEKGGPITLTHKEITRFFMTIPEACSLILEAGAMGKGGEIFVFDMGEPVKIYDLAIKMIKLSGLELGKDIIIREIGLRQGEKLYEELLSNKESTLPTYHPKIMRAKVRKYDKETTEKHLDELANLILENNAFDLVAKMKEIVPEYISNNSVYEVLDKQSVEE